MKYRLLLIFVLFFNLLFGQENTRNEVRKTIDYFIEAHNNQNINQLNKLLDQNVGFMTIFYDGAKSILAAESMEMYIQSLKNATLKKVRQELFNYQISHSNVMATVWSEYKYFINNKLSHCGEVAFQLYKTAKGWKIIQITETRYNKIKCGNNITTKYDVKATLIKFLDKWHKDASKANFNEYFNAIAENGVYIGTDPNEFWTKKEFKNWAKKFFKKKSAWHFETISRDIFFNEDEDFAWFNEKLKTSMGICHATGVAKSSLNGWKIQYYQLSVTLPNELMKQFLELKKNKSK